VQCIIALKLFKDFFLKQFGLGTPINSSLVEKGKRNLNSFSRNKIHVINILLPDPVLMPNTSHSISKLGYLLSLTRVKTNCSLVVTWPGLAFAKKKYLV